MKVTALIPIKLDSERVPGKNIKKLFDGTPLMFLIQRACLRSRYIDEIYVYCSDSSITDYVLDGVKYLRRPEYLDANDMNCNDIIREFMKEVVSDVYIVCHATGPFTSSESMDECIEAVIEEGYDSAFLAKRLQAFVWKEGRPLNFNPQNFPRTQDLEPMYVEASGAFVFPKETFELFGRRVGACPYICEVSEVEAIDIDNPVDFKIANAIYKEMM